MNSRQRFPAAAYYRRLLYLRNELRDFAQVYMGRSVEADSPVMARALAERAWQCDQASHSVDEAMVAIWAIVQTPVAPRAGG